MVDLVIIYNQVFAKYGINKVERHISEVLDMPSWECSKNQDDITHMRPVAQVTKIRSNTEKYCRLIKPIIR